MPDHDTDFEGLIEEAQRELGITVGPDKPLDDAAKEPSIAPQSQVASASAEEGLPDNAEYVVWYGTNRKPISSKGDFKGFSSEPSETTYYGKCRVFVPRSHKIGSIGSPWWKRVTTTDDRLKLLATDAFGDGEFWKTIKNNLQIHGDSDRSAVVFIHGYNVSFENAALRAAQIGFDLSIKTCMAFFSWPSDGTYGGYLKDETSILDSAKSIENFLVDFVDHSGASVVHLIAHSMGNRGLLHAMKAVIAKAEGRTKKRFGNIILAAPDVSSKIFENDCGCYVEAADRVTLYVSRKDRAVLLSRWLHSFTRVGLTPPLFVTDGIDTINVTDVDLTMLGHGYIAEARAVLDDMFRLLATGWGPSQRGLQRRKTAKGEPYWEFRASG